MATLVTGIALSRLIEPIEAEERKALGIEENLSTDEFFVAAMSAFERAVVDFVFGR